MSEPCLPGLFDPRARPVADTSLMAYERILPTLSTREWAVLQALVDEDRPQGWTGGELAESMGLDKTSVRPRLTSLSDHGLVTTLPARKSRVRGETVAHPYRAVVNAAALARVRR